MSSTPDKYDQIGWCLHCHGTQHRDHRNNLQSIVLVRLDYLCQFNHVNLGTSVLNAEKLFTLQNRKVKHFLNWLASFFLF